MLSKHLAALSQGFHACGRRPRRPPSAPARRRAKATARSRPPQGRNTAGAYLGFTFLVARVLAGCKKKRKKACGWSGLCSNRSHTSKPSGPWGIGAEGGPPPPRSSKLRPTARRTWCPSTQLAPCRGQHFQTGRTPALNLSRTRPPGCAQADASFSPQREGRETRTFPHPEPELAPFT